MSAFCAQLLGAVHPAVEHIATGGDRPTSPGVSRYTLHLAQQRADVRAAQRLRYHVFAGEMGAVLHAIEPGLDVDDFDAHCDHLVVREDATGEIVGTYRMLSPEGARRAGKLYAYDPDFGVADFLVLLALDGWIPGTCAISWATQSTSRHEPAAPMDAALTLRGGLPAPG